MKLQGIRIGQRFISTEELWDPQVLDVFWSVWNQYTKGIQKEIFNAWLSCLRQTHSWQELDILQQVKLAAFEIITWAQMVLEWERTAPDRETLSFFDPQDVLRIINSTNEDNARKEIEQAKWKMEEKPFFLGEDKEGYCCLCDNSGEYIWEIYTRLGGYTHIDSIESEEYVYLLVQKNGSIEVYKASPSNLYEYEEIFVIFGGNLQNIISAPAWANDILIYQKDKNIIVYDLLDDGDICFSESENTCLEIRNIVRYGQKIYVHYVSEFEQQEVYIIQDCDEQEEIIRISYEYRFIPHDKGYVVIFYNDKEEYYVLFDQDRTLIQSIVSLTSQKTWNPVSQWDFPEVSEYYLGSWKLCIPFMYKNQVGELSQGSYVYQADDVSRLHDQVYTEQKKFLWWNTWEELWIPPEDDYEAIQDALDLVWDIFEHSSYFNQKFTKVFWRTLKSVILCITTASSLSLNHLYELGQLDIQKFEKFMRDLDYDIIGEELSLKIETGFISCFISQLKTIIQEAETTLRVFTELGNEKNHQNFIKIDTSEWYTLFQEKETQEIFLCINGEFIPGIRYPDSQNFVHFQTNTHCYIYEFDTEKMQKFEWEFEEAYIFWGKYYLQIAYPCSENISSSKIYCWEDHCVYEKKVLWSIWRIIWLVEIWNDIYALEVKQSPKESRTYKKGKLYYTWECSDQEIVCVKNIYSGAILWEWKGVYVRHYSFWEELVLETTAWDKTYIQVMNEHNGDVSSLRLDSRNIYTRIHTKNSVTYIVQWEDGLFSLITLPHLIQYWSENPKVTHIGNVQYMWENLTEPYVVLHFQDGGKWKFLLERSYEETLH